MSPAALTEQLGVGITGPGAGELIAEAALAAALRRLAGRADLADALSAGGLAAYRSQASEEVLGARWRGLIESLVRA